MKIQPKNFLRSLALLIALAGCGSGGDNSVQAILNGRQVEMAVQAVDCFAGYPSGGYTGPSNSPVECVISFRSRGFFADVLQIKMDDVLAINNNYLGQPLPINVTPVYADMSFQGQPLLITGGAIRFTEVANVQGEKVCAEYEFQAGNGVVNGHFCGRVRGGF